MLAIWNSHKVPMCILVYVGTNYLTEYSSYFVDKDF